MREEKLNVKYEVDDSLMTDYLREKHYMEVFESNNYGKYKVLGIHGKKYYESGQYQYLWVIEFINTGVKKIVSNAHMIKGDVGDSSVLSNVEYDCELIKDDKLRNCEYEYPSHHPLSSRWSGLFGRSHNKNDRQYRPTGEVCKRWWSFQNFIDDCNNIVGYKEMIENPDIKFHIDKDLFGDGKMLYSPETCCFIPEAINAAIARESINHTNAKHKNGYGFVGLISSGTLRYRAMGKFQGTRFTIPTDDDKYIVHSNYWNKKREIVREYCNGIYPFLDKRIEDRLIYFFNEREKESLKELKRADEDGLFETGVWATRRDWKNQPYYQKQLKKNRNN